MKKLLLIAMLGISTGAFGAWCSCYDGKCPNGRDPNCCGFGPSCCSKCCTKKMCTQELPGPEVVSCACGKTCKA